MIQSLITITKKTRLIFVFFLLLTKASIIAALPGFPSEQTTPIQSASPPPSPAPRHLPLPPKPVLPPMKKPFGMPGVVGLQSGKWEGTDYLGYLSNNIGIDVEILKAESVPVVPDVSVIESQVRQIFTKENIIPHAEAVEGPPLPFLHILLIIYPVEHDRYAIFGAARLFEQIQVIRKDFIPAGYWQGITWENQDVSLSNGQQLDSQIKALVDKLATMFAKRYRQYNPGYVAPQNIQQPAH